MHLFSLFCCVFIDLFKVLINFFLKDLYYNHKGYFTVFFSCASTMLQFSGPAVVGLLGSNGDVLSWMLFIVFLLEHLSIWN